MLKRLVSPDETGALLSGKITLCGQIKQGQHKGVRELWGVVVETLVRVGVAIIDFKPEFINAFDDPLWCLRVSEDKGLLLKPLGDNYQRVGIFFFGVNEGIETTGQTYFEDSEWRSLTLCVNFVSEIARCKPFV